MACAIERVYEEAEPNGSGLMHSQPPFCAMPQELGTGVRLASFTSSSLRSPECGTSSPTTLCAMQSATAKLLRPGHADSKEREVGCTRWSTSSSSEMSQPSLERMQDVPEERIARIRPQQASRVFARHASYLIVLRGLSARLADGIYHCKSRPSQAANFRLRRHRSGLSACRCAFRGAAEPPPHGPRRQ
jgi:hypothetical protein